MDLETFRIKQKNEPWDKFLKENGFAITLRNEVITRDNINKFVKGFPKSLEEVKRFFIVNYTDIEKHVPMYPDSTYKDGKFLVGSIPKHRERLITLEQLDDLGVKLKTFDYRLRKNIFKNNFSISMNTIDETKYFWINCDNWIELYDKYLISIAKFPK